MVVKSALSPRPGCAPPWVSCLPLPTSSCPIHDPAHCTLVSVPLLLLKTALAKTAGDLFVTKPRLHLLPFLLTDLPAAFGTLVHTFLEAIFFDLSATRSFWLLLLILCFCFSIFFLLGPYTFAFCLGSWVTAYISKSRVMLDAHPNPHLRFSPELPVHSISGHFHPDSPKAQQLGYVPSRSGHLPPQTYPFSCIP